MNKYGFIKITDLGTDELISEALNNGGALATPKESQMLLKLNGVSINSKPRKDGRYQGYVLSNGEKNYFYGRSIEEVTGKIKQYIKDGTPPKRKKRTVSSPKFSDYAAQWIERYKVPNMKPTSVESLRYALKKAIDALGEKPLATITTDDLQAFFMSMPPSRSRDLCAVYVGQLFKKAYGTGIIKKNPFEQVELKKHTPKKRNALTVDEQAAFLATAQSSVHFLLYKFLLATGLRIGEALALSPADLKYGKASVSKDIVFIAKEAIIQTPKSAAAFRSVPVPNDIYAELCKIKTSRIFPVSYGAVSMSMKKLSKKLGFTVSAHILRHTYATRLEEAGIPPKVKQYLLGHATLDMTQNVYTDAQNDYIESVSDRVRAVFDTK